MIDDPNFQWERFPYEALNAIAADAPPERRNALLERVRTNVGVLTARPGDGGVELLVDGEPVAAIPLYRLAKADHARLHPYANAALARFSPDEAARLVEAFHAGDFEIGEDIDDDYVRLDIAGVKVVKVHRRLLVEGWPDEDAPS